MDPLLGDRGRRRIESVPTVGQFIATLSPWLTVIGIISLSAGATPERIGIALIVVGIGLTKILTFGQTEAVEPA